MALFKRKTWIKFRGVPVPTPSGKQWVFIVYALFMGAVIADFAIEEHHFQQMTPAQHLSAAKAKKSGGESDVNEGLRHVAAIPASAPESAEAKTVETDLQNRKTAYDDAAREAQQARAAQVSAVKELGESLKNRGYDVKVSKEEKENGIVIVSSDFDDTEKRVRFLSTLRGREGLSYSVCSAGLITVRLRSSEYLFGFNESYSLECYR
jgi:hypothetical protein